MLEEFRAQTEYNRIDDQAMQLLQYLQAQYDALLEEYNVESTTKLEKLIAENRELLPDSFGMEQTEIQQKLSEQEWTLAQLKQLTEKMAAIQKASEEQDLIPLEPVSPQVELQEKYQAILEAMEVEDLEELHQEIIANESLLKEVYGEEEGELIETLTKQRQALGELQAITTAMQSENESPKINSDSEEKVTESDVVAAFKQAGIKRLGALNALQIKAERDLKKAQRKQDQEKTQALENKIEQYQTTRAALQQLLSAAVLEEDFEVLQEGQGSRVVIAEESEQTTPLVDSPPLPSASFANNLPPIEQSQAALCFILEQAAQLPMSAERLLLQLRCVAQWMIAGYGEQVLTDYQLQDPAAYCAELGTWLQAEGQGTQSVLGLVQQLSQALAVKNWFTVFKQTSVLLKQYRPFDTAELQRLVTKAEQAAKQVKDQDIILLLGRTGAGKSTTIHFLAGSTMQETQVQMADGDTIEHIAPIETSNPYLKEVETHPGSTSVTRYIAPVPVNSSELPAGKEGSERKTVVLCDTPGFGDTAGAEVDIANGIGIIRAVRGCKSVRPMVILSQYSVGDRLEGIAEIVRLLIHLMPDLVEYTSAFSYVFNKFKRGTNVASRLKDLIEKSMDQSHHSEAYQVLLKDMERKVRRGQAVVLDPVKDHPGDLLDQLIGTTAIDKPDEVFKSYITESSEKTLAEQVNAHFYAVESLLQTEQVPTEQALTLLSKRMQELKTLATILDLHVVKEGYQKCIQQISIVIQKHYTAGKTHLARGLRDSASHLEESEMKYFAKELAFFEQMDPIVAEHLSTEYPQSSRALKQWLIIQAQSLQASLTESNQYQQQVSDPADRQQWPCVALLATVGEQIDVRLLSRRLAKLNMLAQHFSNVASEITHTYQQAQSASQHYVNQLAQHLQQALTGHDYAEFAQGLQFLQILKTGLEGHVSPKWLDKHMQQLTQQCLAHVANIGQIGQCILQHDPLQETDLVELQSSVFKPLDSIRHSTLLMELLGEATLSESRDQLMQTVEHRFEQMVQVLLAFGQEQEKDIDGEKMQQAFNQLELIRNISPEIERITSELYFKVSNHLLVCVNQLKADAERIMGQVFSHQGKVQFSELRKALDLLRQVKWVDKLQPGLYDNSLSNINERLGWLLQDLNDEINQVDASMTQPTILVELANKLSNVDQMKQLDDVLPELKEKREPIIQAFAQQIQELLTSINQAYDLDNHSIKEEQQRLDQLQAIEAEYYSHSQAVAFLQGKGYEQGIEELQQALGQVIRQRDTLTNEIEGSKQMIAKYRKQYEKAEAFRQAINETGFLTLRGKSQEEIQSMLGKNGLANMDDLDMKISEFRKGIIQVGNQQTTQEVQLSTLNSQISQLQHDKAEYKRLVEQGDIDETAANRALKRENIESIAQLKQAIQSLEEQVIDCQKNALGHSFDISGSFDFNQAKRTFHCLNQLAQIKVEPCRREIKSTKQNFSRYLKTYVRYLQMQLEKTYVNIENHLHQGHDLDITHCGQLVSKCFSELRTMRDLQNDWPEELRHLSLLSLCEQWQTKLTDDLRTLRERMQQRHNEGQNLQKEISVARSLNRLDNELFGNGVAGIVVDDGYVALSREYTDKMYDEAREIRQEMRDSVRDHNFQQVAEQMNTFQEIADPNQRARAEQKTQKLLDNETEKLITEVRRSLAYIGPEMRLESVQELMIGLRKLQNASVIVDTLSEKMCEKRKTTLEDVKIELNRKLDRYVEGVSELIRHYNFQHAESRMTHLDELVSNLRADDVLEEEVLHKITELSKQIEGSLAEKIAAFSGEKYDYMTAPPRDVYEKLQAVFMVQERGNAYQQAWEEIKRQIFDDFRQKLVSLRDEQQLSVLERKRRVREMRSLLSTLPDDFEKRLERELKNLEEDLESHAQETAKHVTELLESGTPEKIKEELTRCEKTEDGAMAYTLKTGVKKRVKALRDKLFEKIDEKNYVALSSDLDDLSQFYQHLLIVDPVVKLYKTIADRLTKTFADACESIAQSIARQNQAVSETEIEAMRESLITISQFMQLKQSQAEARQVPELLFGPRALEFLTKLHQDMADRFANLAEQYQKALKSGEDIAELMKALDGLRTWDPLRQQISNYVEKSYSSEQGLGFEYLTSHIKALPPYQQSVKALLDMINEHAEALTTVTLISDMTRTDKGREEFYIELDQRYSFIKQLSRFSKSVHLTSLPKSADSYIEQAKQRLLTQLEQNRDRTLALLRNQAEPSQAEFDEITSASLNLETCAEYFKADPDVSDQARQSVQALKSLLDKRLEGLRVRFEAIKEDKDGQKAVIALVALKRWGESSPMLKEAVDKHIDGMLQRYQKQIGGGEKIARLGLALSQEETGLGEVIVADHGVFQGYQRAIFNRKTQTCDIKQVLDKIEGEGVELNLPKLAQAYDTFNSRYDTLVTLYLRKPINIDPLLTEVKQQAALMRAAIESTRAVRRHGGSPVHWDRTVLGKLVDFLAKISALWTLMNADEFFEAAGSGEREAYLLKPHPAQVVAIFRMLGIGDAQEHQKHNLVEMGTGEGKSIVLGITASVFALLGAQVSCACYSDYLSSRDNDAFKPLFERLGIVQAIQYGTFNEICEQVINEDGEVRDLTRRIIEDPTSIQPMMQYSQQKAAKVLLIDEVDVFLNEEFYGNIYRPSTRLGHLPQQEEALPQPKPELKALTDLVWLQRSNSQWGFEDLEASPQYQACCQAFVSWEALVREAAKDMLADVRGFKAHHYVVVDDMIGYKEQDAISFEIAYGYKTLFAYYHEVDQGRVSPERLLAQITLIIQCGSFSYAELPKQFQLIVGVTGTLRTLSQPELKIIRDVYKINKFTYAPSVFGDKKLLPMREREDILICDQQDYYNTTCTEIENRLQGRDSKKRAVLVFFETEEKLQAFQQYSAFEALQQRYMPALVMTESLSKREKTAIIRRVPTAGQITLSTKTFGRGTDFVCREKQVASGGGVHVLPTFLSEELSEETQIKGRTARQGEEGSYSMVLLAEDLEKYRIFKDDIEEAQQQGRLYKMLNEKRAAFFEEKYEGSHKFVKQARQEHEQGQRFIEKLLTRRADAVKDFLVQRNQGAMVEVRSRTLVLMDATYSMSSLLKKSKNTVDTMFERTAMVLQEKGVPGNCFQMQYAVYRNYNSPHDKLLQSSPWVSRADHLRKFMDTINVEGGYGNEAIEIGLWHANTEASKGNKKVSQIIVIGDAAANTEQEVQSKRGIKGESYWQATPFAQTTHWRPEMQRLAQRRIPVHCFFVEKRAQENFRKIAQASNPRGRCKALDIHSKKGAEELTDLVTTQVLEATGGREYVEKYEEMKNQGRFHVK